MTDAAGVRAFEICRRLRCWVTGHPVGTDTWMDGYWCECDACQTVLAVRNALAPGDAGERLRQLVGAYDAYLLDPSNHDALANFAAGLEQARAFLAVRREKEA